MRALILFAILFAAVSARAEYRVFVLEITDQKTGVSRNVTTTLDDIQYPGYYPLNPGEQIKIAATWMCYKNRTETFATYCPQPDPSPRAPASPVLK